MSKTPKAPPIEAPQQQDPKYLAARQAHRAPLLAMNWTEAEIADDWIEKMGHTQHTAKSFSGAFASQGKVMQYVREATGRDQDAAANPDMFEPIGQITARAKPKKADGDHRAQQAKRTAAIADGMDDGRPHSMKP